VPSKPINQIERIIGKTKLTTEEFTIEAGKVEEFANAIKSTNPIFRDAEAAAQEGYDQIPAPPTFIMTSNFPRYTPDDIKSNTTPFDVGFQPGCMLHGEQEFEFKRPIYVGDVLTGETTFADVYQREGDQSILTFVELKTEYTTTGGDLVVDEQTTIIERGTTDE